MTETPDRLSTALADRYTIERELGAGGMATVYLAEDLRHHRQVAIKVLRPELAAVLGAERFVQEIRTTAQLQHPHILPLFDSGEADGFLFYVMPYVEGETLRDKLSRETQLGIDDAVRIAREVADALDYAHRHGVIHRDIKPENILLHDGRPMVADFGIALALSAAAGGRMTETGMSLGTPHYMSPEQATADKDITGRSDIYSLASVLYEMLTGNPPHVGSSAQQIIMKIIAEPVAEVTALRKSVPPNVAAALAKALEKLPADRFESAKAFADALGNPAFTTANATTEGRATRRSSSRPAMFALTVTAVAAVGVAGWALTRSGPAPPVSRYALALPEQETPDRNGPVAITADGARIVYLGPPATGRDRPQLWVKQRDRLHATPLPGTEGATAAAISPDNAWIVIAQGGAIRKLPITGGASMTLAEGVTDRGGSVAWLGDGTLVYAARDTFRIVSIPDTGGIGTVIWSSDSIAPSALAPLPDARGFLFQGCWATCSQAAVWAFDRRTDSARIAITGARGALYLSTGDLVYVRADGGAFTAFGIPFDLASLRPRGAPVALIDSIRNAGIAPYLTVSASGTLVMQHGANLASQRLELVWVDRAGHETAVDSTWRFWSTQAAGNHGWALSPDGTRLVIGLHTESGDDIWIRTLPRGPTARVTFDTGYEARPRWLPNGQSITFITDHGAFVRRADGTGSDSALWAGGAVDEAQESPDGRWLLFRRGAVGPSAGGRDIFGIRLGVDSVPVPVVVTRYDEMAIELSPDGHWLAYQSDETGRREVFVRPFPNTADSKWQVSNGGGTAPLWARNGHELFYLRGDSTMMAVNVTTTPTFAPGEARVLFHLPGTLFQLSTDWYTPWDVAADGRFIMARMVGTPDRQASPLIVVDNWLEEVKQIMKP
jgi:hypothetical protein